MGKVFLFSAMFSLIFFVVELAIITVMIVATWKLYKKAGEPGWAAIVPFYNSYIMYKISGKKNLFWASLVCGIGTAISYAVMLIEAYEPDPYYYGARYRGGQFYSYSYGDPDINVALIGVCAVLLLVFAIASLVLRILMCIGLAKSFGHGGGFACGLIFLNIIFICILGFSKEFVYIGPNGTPYGRSNMYGQNPYGHLNNQNMYGGNMYGQNPYGQPNNQNMYGGNVYGQNPYGQPDNQNMYGGNMYGQNPYGQPDNQNMYGGNMYGQNPYGQPDNQNMYNQNAYSQQNNQNVYNQNTYSQAADQNISDQNQLSQQAGQSAPQDQARPWNDIYNQ